MAIPSWYIPFHPLYHYTVCTLTHSAIPNPSYIPFFLSLSDLFTPEAPLWYFTAFNFGCSVSLHFHTSVPQVSVRNITQFSKFLYRSMLKVLHLWHFLTHQLVFIPALFLISHLFAVSLIYQMKGHHLVDMTSVFSSDNSFQNQIPVILPVFLNSSCFVTFLVLWYVFTAYCPYRALMP